LRARREDHIPRPGIGELEVVVIGHYQKLLSPLFEKKMEMRSGLLALAVPLLRSLILRLSERK
jgi:hypothetical protein